MSICLFFSTRHHWWWEIYLFCHVLVENPCFCKEPRHIRFYFTFFFSHYYYGCFSTYHSMSWFTSHSFLLMQTTCYHQYSSLWVIIYSVEYFNLNISIGPTIPYHICILVCLQCMTILNMTFWRVIVIPKWNNNIFQTIWWYENITIFVRPYAPSSCECAIKASQNGFSTCKPC